MSAGGGRDVAVVGAGVVGLACALRLRRAGFDVRLIDRDEPGRGASWGNAGHIATEQVFPLASPATVLDLPRLLLGRHSPLSLRLAYLPSIAPWLLRFAWASRPGAFRRGAEALAALQRRAMGAMRALCRDAGIASLLRESGHLVALESERSRPAAEALRRRLEPFGIAAGWLDRDGVAERAPALAPAVRRGLLFEGSGHVADPYELCRGLHAAFAAAGGCAARARVRRIEDDGTGGFRLLTDGEALRAGRLVLAAGAWSGPLARDLGAPVPLDTERGYHVTLPGRSGGLTLPVESFERKVIMTPMSCGLRMTGMVEFGGLALAPNPARWRRLEGDLRELLPGTDLAGASRWMGFRPSLPDMLPVIGRAPRRPNAILAFGHQHLGLTLSAVTADCVAALAAGEPPPVDLAPFRPDRF